jgi:hypothetical protein
MRIQPTHVIAFICTACALNCPAQDPQQPRPPQEVIPQPRQSARPKLPTGSLSGAVYCADTNLPARLATVYLLEITDTSFSTRNSVQSDLEGRFAFNRVPEGDYYVIALLPGYVNLMHSLTLDDLSEISEDDRKKILAELASATVSADQPAQVSIRLDRGAEIDGTVLYDDGSPAIGLRMRFRLKPAKPEAQDPMEPPFEQDPFYAQNGPPTTDDRGHFRILGVPPGEYLVSALVPAASSGHSVENQFIAMMNETFGTLNVYVGNGLRASKAETIKVDAGGAAKDADITIPLSKLHTVRGQVLLKSTGQPPANARVDLIYADTRERVHTAMAPNGEFEIPYVPEGNLILRAVGDNNPLPNMDAMADDAEGTGIGAVAESASVEFVLPGARAGDEDFAELPLTVSGDIDNVTISVPDPPKNPQSILKTDTTDELRTAPSTPSDHPQ